MSYNPAYTTSFRSLDDTVWEIVILVNGYEGPYTEIALEGDEPCVIDWQETDVADVVQTAVCTLRVSNEKDRQMVLLMTNRDAQVYIARNKVPYWAGWLDESVYEEPYSFTEGYVTELTFSDFGVLNRTEFVLHGRQTVDAVVRDCLASMGFANTGYVMLTTLLHPKTQQPIDLAHVYIDAERFYDGYGKRGPSKRRVLEEVLRPFGLRIVQMNFTIRIYDIDHLRDHPALHARIAWKGTDAYLHGSETHGIYDLEFATDAHETLADASLLPGWIEDTLTDDNGNIIAMGYDDISNGENLIGFYFRNVVGSDALPVVHASGARFFNTRAKTSDASDNGMSWRVQCLKITGYFPGSWTPITADVTPVNNHPTRLLADVQPVFSLLSGYLPRTRNADSHRLRISLDFLLSFRRNPFDSPPDGWVQNQDWHAMEDFWEMFHWRAMMLPVKLELVDDLGNAIYHYKNATTTDTVQQGWGLTAAYVDIQVGEGTWEPGAAGFGDMVLAYYNDPDDDGTCATPLVGKAWTGNRHSRNYGFHRNVNSGEYAPLPPAGGRLRLTVGSGVFPTGVVASNYTYSHFELFFLYYNAIRWQLYRNPEIGLMRAWRRDNGIDTSAATDGEDTMNLWPNPLSESVMFGCWQKGVAPSARGLLTDASGNAFEAFVRNGTEDTLLHLRLLQLEDQNFGVQPVISGTAELQHEFVAFTDASTGGAFLATARRQDLHSATESVTLRRIANPGGYVFRFAWSQPVCAQEHVQFDYRFRWSNPLCVQKIDYTFAWSQPVCAQEEKYHLDWEPIRETK